IPGSSSAAGPSTTSASWAWAPHRRCPMPGSMGLAEEAAAVAQERTEAAILAAAVRLGAPARLRPGRARSWPSSSWVFACSQGDVAQLLRRQNALKPPTVDEEGRRARHTQLLSLSQ